MVVQDHLASAFRHADDAARLLASDRSDNAAYLAGYVIECGLKQLIESSPHYHGKVPWIHDLLSLEVLALAATLAQADAVHSFPQAAIDTARSLRWKVAWRYVPDGHVPTSDAGDIVAAASTMRDALSFAIIDGRITP